MSSASIIMLKDPEVIKEGEFRGTPKTQSFRKPRKKTSMLKREVNGNSVVRNSSPPTLFKTIQHGNVGKQSMAPSGGTASAGASGLAPGAPSRVPSAGPSSAPSTAQPGAPSKVIGMSGGIFSTTILDEPRSLQIMNSQVAFFPKTPASTIDRWYVFASSILAFLILCVCIIATHRVSGMEHIIIPLDAFNMESLYRHNYYRELYGVPPLSLDLNLAKQAQNEIKKVVNFGNARSQLGRTMFASHAPPKRKGKKKGNYPTLIASGYDMVESFYKGKSGYDSKMHGCSDKYKHVDCLAFVQVVWKSTQRLGCAYKYRDNSSYSALCVYDPPGQIPEQFLANVPPPK